MSDTEDTKRKEISPALDFFAGTVAGMAAVVVGYPFDTVKVRFQNPQTASRYRSATHAFFTIVREERIRGLYRGIAAPLAGAPPLNGIVFSSYRSLLHAQLDDDNAIPTLTQVNLAGAGTGIISSYVPSLPYCLACYIFPPSPSTFSSYVVDASLSRLITTPAELIKIHQQSLVRTSTSGSSPPLRDRDVILHLWRTLGLRGFFRGITATALRDTGYGAYFAAYEATLRYWPRPHAPPTHDRDGSPAKQVESTLATLSWPAMLVAGGMAGIAGWVVTFPFDVVKTRVQSTPPGVPGNPYRTTWSTIVASYRAEGLGVFFRGLAPTLIRAIPVNMVTFTTFEAVVGLCS
ncbi:mitochondrial carrier [Lentinus tigrinus ALCF2SS1-7]|uniref:Mitochondrial carrier n=1 Tax=Lentinus tigrinus ALCF2SS1-6 TaxID=1328759 RepID=A0A5C2S1B9_9APHY|nr:mitochondrial carrier [Lentinus tigrinus ALCF2SS1-6]RPD73061.1 mitochondrial carrier [Lentinus tigrinus ALCF2SS1-7]